jgi:heptosyltransferase I
MRANFASMMVSAPTKLGFDRARAREYQWYFCNEHLPPKPEQHVMDGLFEFIEQLGIPRGDLRWDIPVSAADREFAVSAIGTGRPSLVISPCSSQRFKNYRNWRIESYTEVANYAAARYGAQVLLTGGPTELERDYARRIAAGCVSPPRDFVGRTSLKQLLAVLERASVLLCPDSGPAHMATATGTPVVTLFATSNRFRTGPYLSQHLAVDRYPDAVRKEFGGSVQELRWGQRVRDPDAMNLITVPDVIAKLDEAFAQRGVRPVG